MEDNIVIIIVMAILVLMVIATLWTVWKLLFKFPSEDERGKLIVMRASTSTFIVSMLMLIFDTGLMFYKNLETQEGFYFNPVIRLFVLSLLFFISLKRGQRKYGG